MKRSFVVNMLGGFVGFILALLLVNSTNSASALSLNRPADSQAAASIVSAPSVTPISSTFTYQGQLKNGVSPVSGSCDMAFRMYDDPSAGNLIGNPITLTAVSMVNGYFTVGLDFGPSAVTGIARWLALRVRCPAGSGSYTPLSPRQPLTPAPAALTLGAPGSVSGYMVFNPDHYPTIGFNDSGPSDGSAYVAGVAGYGGLFQFHDETGDLTYWTGSDVPAGVSHVHAPGLTIDANGNVGLGTTSPQVKLHVSGASSGLRLESSDSSTWTLTDYKTDAREWHTGVGGSTVGNDVNSKYYIYDSTANQFRMVVDTLGNVGIGTTDPAALLDIRGPGPLVFHATNSSGTQGLAVYSNGRVQISHLEPASTVHMCKDATGYLSTCASAAEYAPSIDGGFGFPETADLVSIAPAVSNPYSDTHGPFTVQKSSTACDPNLLGYITDPEKGADGEKKNDHYLPLAIFGYFPAKVTLENGAIHRGDPLTSSSKPGYAMKATQACKIIGYALEDAKAERTIQVFAHLSENTAPVVASLAKQLDETKATNANLEARVSQLEQQNTALATRMSKLEQSAAASNPSSQPGPLNMLNLSGMTVIGGVMIVWLQQRKRRGGEQ